MNNYFDDPPLSNLELPPASLPGVSQLYYQHVQSSKDPTRAAKLESAAISRRWYGTRCRWP